MSRESILERNRKRAQENDRKMGATALGTSALNYSTQQSLEQAAAEKVERESSVSPSIKSPGTLLKNDLFTKNPTQRIQTSPRELVNSRQDVIQRVNAEKQREDQDDYSFKDRANDFLQGTLTSVAGSIGNFIGGALDFADQAGREFLYNTLVIPEEELERRGADTPENLAATELLREIRDRENPLVEGIYDLSDKGLQMGQEQYERAKEGVGPVASTLMDVGRVGIEMGTDALAGALTGGTGLFPMVARSFGGGVSQARANGAEDEEALLAGAAQGGIDYLTERMFGIALPFSKVYGGGSLDDIVQNGITSAVSRFAKTEAGQRALGGGLTLGASALTEGAEEFIADWMGWQLPKIIYDGEVETAEETLSNSLYDFLVGAITGGIGGVVTPATYHYRIPETSTPTLDNQAADSEIVSSPTESATPTEVSRQAQGTLSEALAAGRPDVQSLTPEQMQEWEGRNDIWVDAQDRAYQMDPESHISQRTYDNVRDRSVNAFQFDHPELQPYYREAAQKLLDDAENSLSAPRDGRFERTTQGKQYIQSIVSTRAMRDAMNMGLTRQDIIQAAENLIADHGQENYAAAKRLEIVLDSMLTNGYTDTYGNRFSPNEDYIRMKQEIPGYQPPEDLPIWDMDEGRGRTSEELAQDMLQVQKAATVLGENGSKALTAAYDRNIARNYSPEQVVQGFYQTYNAVMEGKESPSVDLPEQVKIAAESSAQLDRTRAEQARYFGENSGLVRDQNQKKARLSTQDSRRLDALGKALGVQIRFETAINDGAGHEANAKYGDGVISLSLDAEDPVFTSVIHEAVHRIRETDPDAYTQLSDLVQTNMTDETMGFSLGSRSQLYGTENRDSLTEELVADAFGRMVRGESLDKLVQDNRTVVQKVLDVIRDIITKIQKTLSGKEVSLTENQKAEFRDLEGRMVEMERTFREALERQQSREGGQESGETRFSMKSPVEETEDLVALHNLTEDKLRSALRLGGFPMPSIAVTRADIPHTNFGDITLVMSRKTVDPRANRRNTVYSADAWTPTFPAIEYEADPQVERRISRRIGELSAQVDPFFQDDLRRIQYGLDDYLNRHGGEEGLARWAMDNYGLKAAYLEEQGNHIAAVTTQREADRGYNMDRAERYQAVADVLGTTDPETIGSMNMKDMREQYGEALEQAFPGMTKSAFRMSGILRQVQEYFRDQGGELVYETVTDSAATRRAVDEALDRAEYERWVLDLYSGIEAASGVYNNKERFTPSGNLRSFQQTHYPVTLEGIVKAMAGQNGGNTKNVSGFYGVKSLRAGTAQRFKSIADMHKLEGRLQNLTEAEQQAISDALDERLIEITGELAEKSPGGAREYDYTQSDTIGHILVEIADGGNYTIDSIMRKFNEEYGYQIGNELAAKVRDLLFDVSQMPVNLFEAKPERAVSFDEVLAAVVPDDSSKELMDALAQARVRTLEYKSGDDADRIQQVNSVEGARFSLKSTDSQGRNLTAEQQEFFRDSKVRIDEWGDYGTEDGPLVPAYHATWNDEFTVFDRQRLGENTDINSADEVLASTAHVGFWFNSQDLSARNGRRPRAGSRAEEVYLNITKPYYAGTLDGLANEILDYSEAETPAARGEEFRDYLQSKGYDGIILNDSEFGGVSFVAFEPEQIKRTANRTPTSDPDIRYSLSNREQLDQYIQEYGAIPRGERPYREVQIPKRTSKTQKVSQTVRTILEAQATPDEAVQSIEELIADGTLSYNPYSDRQAMTDAENTIRDKGYATALSDWTRSVRDGEVSKRLTAEGWALYNQAANAGDMKSAMTILTNMVEHQRNAAQALQATRILKKMSPESQLYGVQRSAQNLTRELKDKYGSDYPDIRIDEKLATRFLEAKTDRERDQAMQDLYRDIGRQMPSRFIDKWNAWRYLAMLGNPRTHIRNITGNAFFTPVIAAKDLTATAIESAVGRVSGGKIGRTKGMVTPKDRDILMAAWNDFANSQDRILGGGKYSDSANANRYIQEGRRIFRNPILERARTANSQALDLEDAWFSKPHYAYALAQYAKANGITAEQIRSGKGLDAARAYAIREAQKATYRDTNAFSEMVSGWGRYRGDNKIRRVGSTVLEGILPFRKTPANILVRGVEYSPLGLLKGLTYDLAQVKKGNMEASTAIDNISAGLTGTGLLTLGVYLAAEGLVRGAGGDDDSEREYEELQGHQAYSLELGDQSFTLDWLAPEALPFFVGVNLWEQTQAENEDVTLSAMLQSVQNITDPILEMSCLQSLNDVFDAVGYASSEDLGALPSILSSAATSYLTQGIPTIFGQAERTGQDVRMTTYTERNAFLTSDMQYTIGRASSRIPGWDYQQIPYIDAWGRTESSGTVGRRAVDNFLNPAYSSTIIESPMEAELERLYEQTGDTGVLPSRAVRYVTVDGERKDLTAEEYVKYAQNKGQTAYNILTELTAGAAYQAATDDVKAEMVDLVYQYSNDTAKASVSSYKPDGWVAKAQAAEKMGITESQYISLYVQQKSIESLKDRNGETIPDSKGLQIMELVYGVKGLTDNQRQKLFEDFNVGKNVRHFNQTLVKNRLERMRKQ